MKGIYKRPNSQFYQIRYRGLDGRIIRESTGTTKLREAQTLLHKRKAQIDAGKQPEVKKISNYSFKQLADKYSQWMQGRHRSADSKKYRIRELVSIFGGLKLREMNLFVFYDHYCPVKIAHFAMTLPVCYATVQA